MIYAIGDLHLSQSTNKPMDIFGANWKNHSDKIKNNWNQVVKEDDLVVVCGDLSWALKLEEAIADLEYLDNLNGSKVLIKGNHDLWWSSKSKLEKLMSHQNMTLQFIHNNAFDYREHVICGTRGWICEGAREFTDSDMKIYQREALRLEQSLKSNRNLHKGLIVAMHYPPMNEYLDESLFVKLFKEYGVKRVIYGHLHGRDAFVNGPKGIIDGIEYDLVSADYLDFKLKLIEDYR